MSGRPPPRLLFLHPKTLIDSWPFPVDTLGEVIKVPSIVYPLLAATIADLPVEIEIFDGYVTPERFDDYKDRLRRADILAIAVMSPLKVLDTELTLRLARRLNPHVRIILGGNHATAFAERWIEKGADFVVTHEGEVAFPALVRALLEGGPVDRVPNLVYSRDGAPARVHERSPDIALEDSPIPAWHRMNLRPYRPRIGPEGLAATLEVSRGCPHRCDFCNINKFWSYSQRYKSIDRVLEELDRLHALGVRQVFISDDNFGHDHDRTCELMEAIIRRDYRMALGAFIRGDTVHRHPDFVSLAARAGLRLALMGIETLDPQWLKAHRKGVRARDVVQMWTGVYTTMRQHGVFVLGLLMHPFTPEDHKPVTLRVDGRVCDAHYTADLLPQKNSMLFDELSRRNDVRLKDMFYHDWNMPSVEFESAPQANRKTFTDVVRNLDFFGVRAFASRERLQRHFRWTNLGVLLERLACTTPADVWRYRTAKDASLPIGERQRRIVESVLDDKVLDELVARRAWRSPLSFRLRGR